MPWCPRCDETFPQGPACPRCSARLVAREREAPEDPLAAVPGLRSIRVSRRDRRALERLSGPRAPSSRVLALALVLLVFVSGYLLGRVGSIGTSQPTVRALPLAEPLAPSNVGSVAYLVSSRDQLVTIALHDLEEGDVASRARFSPPLDPGDLVATRVVSFRGSVAVVVEGDREGHIAFAPHGRNATTGIRGFDVAWLSEDQLLVRQPDGTVARWTSGGDRVTSAPAGDADELIQTTNGAVVRRGDVLEAVGPSSGRRLEVPKNAEVIAVSADTTHAIIGASRPALWDGRDLLPIRAGKGEVLGASFEESGEHAAIVMRDGEELMLAVVDLRGNAALKPVKGPGCAGPPAWDAQGNWVYVSSGDGVLHSVEASGGRIDSIQTHGVGCGLAWVHTP